MKEAVGLSRLDGMRPDGMKLIFYQSDKIFLWDVTVVFTLAEAVAAWVAEVAEQVAARKCAKYVELYLPIPSGPSQ